MNKMRDGKYSALIRGDYLEAMETVNGERSVNAGVVAALEAFARLDRDIRCREAMAQRVRISPSQYFMWLGIFEIPDQVADTITNAYPFPHDKNKTLNAAIRLWLESQGVEGLKA